MHRAHNGNTDITFWGNCDTRSHRKVDLFANTSDAFRRSKGRLDDAYGVCKPVLIDVFYDHFLAKNWSRYAPEPRATLRTGVRTLSHGALALLAGPEG